MDMYDRIKMLREERGWSQDELAEKMGYKWRSSICNIENKTRQLRDYQIVKFAEVFDVTPQYLLLGIKEEPTIEDRLLDILKQLTPDSKEKALEYFDFLLAQQEK